MRLNKGLGLFNFSGDCLLDLNNLKRFSFRPWMWRFPAMFCHAGPSSLAFLSGRIVISKSRRMDCSLKLKLHQLWRTAMWFSHDCSWILTIACFSGVFPSLSECVVPPLVITFEKAYICNSLATVLLFPLCIVIRQDHGFGSPREPHQLPGWLSA